MLLPLETCGIFILRKLGLCPALFWLDERVAQLADRIDEAIIVRSVCLPVVAYSLTYNFQTHARFLVSACQVFSCPSWPARPDLHRTRFARLCSHAQSISLPELMQGVCVPYDDYEFCLMSV